MSDQIIQLLQMHRIRLTEIRERVLEVFFANKFALSHQDIQAQLEERYDRVTLYRTLNKFVENGLIHKVVDGQGITNFALCGRGGSQQERHHHNHLHFQCKCCGHTFCLPKVQLPQIQMPSGFSLDEINIRAEGICENCHH